MLQSAKDTGHYPGYALAFNTPSGFLLYPLIACPNRQGYASTGHYPYVIIQSLC